jgi:hypothetical protein
MGAGITCCFFFLDFECCPSTPGYSSARITPLTLFFLLDFASNGVPLSQITTIPLDTAKVRLQLQKKTLAGDLAGPKYRGLLGTATTIAREEGSAALWKGIVPGLHRQCIYGGLRIGLYEPVRFPNPLFDALYFLSNSLLLRNTEIDWIVCCA